MRRLLNEAQNNNNNQQQQPQLPSLLPSNIPNKNNLYDDDNSLQDDNFSLRQNVFLSSQSQVNESLMQNPLLLISAEENDEKLIHQQQQREVTQSDGAASAVTSEGSIGQEAASAAVQNHVNEISTTECATRVRQQQENSIYTMNKPNENNQEQQQQQQYSFTNCQSNSNLLYTEGINNNGFQNNNQVLQISKGNEGELTSKTNSLTSQQALVAGYITSYQQKINEKQIISQSDLIFRQVTNQSPDGSSSKNASRKFNALFPDNERSILSSNLLSQGGVGNVMLTKNNNNLPIKISHPQDYTSFENNSNQQNSSSYSSSIVLTTPAASKRPLASGYEQGQLSTPNELKVFLNNLTASSIKGGSNVTTTTTKTHHNYQTAHSFNNEQQQSLSLLYHSTPSKLLQPNAQQLDQTYQQQQPPNNIATIHHNPPQRSFSQIQSTGGNILQQQFLSLLNNTNQQMQTTAQIMESMRQRGKQSMVAENHILSEEQRKYLSQPSYAKGGINSIVYHQFRQIKLDLEHLQPQVRTSSQLSQHQSQTQISSNQPAFTPLITEDALKDFYSMKVKMFPNTGRELEVQEDPEPLYDSHQSDHSTCSEAEKRLLYGIQQEIERYRKLQQTCDDTQLPITFRFLRDSTLFFNSRFESGNLREAEKITEFEYNLYLHFDFNTLNYTQWFYFSVRNIKKGFTYKFNIMNLQKDESCYSQGMKPFVYSTQRNKEQETNQWQRGCFDIVYSKNNLKTKHRESAPDYEYDEYNIPCYVYEDEESQSAYLNTLTFSYTFDYDNDVVFFSYFQPYTYSDLKDYIYTLEKRRDESVGAMKNTLKVQKLCNTIEGNPCYVLTISDNVNETSSNKQVIYMTGRVHPGEANSSFMVQGVIDFILQPNCKEAQALRELFIFKIVPMLNPDGVINGNYRCNILGVDLNRRWTNPSKILHPTIYYSKMLAKACATDNTMLFYCDFHGHSRKKNVFMYGCACPQSDINQHKNNNLIRLIPYLVGQRNKLFSFQDCKFANEAAKESTARMVIFRELGVLNSYTLESTFFAAVNKQQLPAGSKKKKGDIEEEQQIKAEDLKSIGVDLCLTIHQIVQSKILRKKLLHNSGGVEGDKSFIGGIIGNINVNQKESTKDMIQTKRGDATSIQSQNSAQLSSQINQMLDSSQVTNPFQLLKETNTLNPRQQALQTSSSQNQATLVAPPQSQTLQVTQQNSNSTPFKRKSNQQQPRLVAQLNQMIQGGSSQGQQTLQPPQTQSSLNQSALTFAQAVFNSQNQVGSGGNGQSTDRGVTNILPGSGVRHQVLKQNLLEPPLGSLPGGVDSILVEQIILSNSHNVGKVSQSSNSGNGQNVLGGGVIAKLLPQSSQPSQQLMGMTVTNEFYRKREQQQSHQVQMQIAPGGGGAGMTRGRMTEVGRIQANNGIHGSGSKSVGASGYSSSASKSKVMSQSVHRQTAYGGMSGNLGGGGGSTLGGSVLAGNNMMIQNLSHAITGADFNQSLNQQATNGGNSFPPVVILKKDPAGQTMFKLGGGPQSGINGASTSMQANQQTSNANPNTNVVTITKRPFSNINLVVPAAYPQTTVQQLICQQQALAASQQQNQGLKPNLLPQTYHQMLPITSNNQILQHNSNAQQVAYDSNSSSNPGEKPSSSPKAAAAAIPLMSNPIIQKAIEQQQMLALQQQQEKQQLQTVRKQSSSSQQPASNSQISNAGVMGSNRRKIVIDKAQNTNINQNVGNSMALNGASPIPQNTSFTGGFPHNASFFNQNTNAYNDSYLNHSAEKPNTNLNNNTSFSKTLVSTFMLSNTSGIVNNNANINNYQTSAGGNINGGNSTYRGGNNNSNSNSSKNNNNGQYYQQHQVLNNQ